jgi:hypothetical protein
MEAASRWVDPLARWEGRSDVLNEGELRRAREAFAVYAGEDLVVPSSKLVLLFRALGLTPSFLDMREVSYGSKGMKRG